VSLNFEPIKPTKLKPNPIIEDTRELRLASPKFIGILDPPAEMMKLSNLMKKLSMLTTTRRRNSQSLNFIWSSRSSRRRWSSWRIRAFKAWRWKSSQSIDPPLWRQPPIALPLCRQRSPLQSAL